MATRGGENKRQVQAIPSRNFTRKGEKEREVTREELRSPDPENRGSFFKAGKARICCQDEGRIRRKGVVPDIRDDTKEKPWRRWRGCKHRIPGSQVRGRASPGDELLRRVLQKRLECSCVDTCDLNTGTRVSGECGR